MGYGKISQPALLALSKANRGSREIAFKEKATQNYDQSTISPTATVPEKQNFSQEKHFYQNEELEFHIDKLKNQSQLVQEEAWKLYTQLSDQKKFHQQHPEYQTS